MRNLILATLAATGLMGALAAGASAAPPSFDRAGVTQVYYGDRDDYYREHRPHRWAPPYAYREQPRYWHHHRDGYWRHGRFYYYDR